MGAVRVGDQGRAGGPAGQGHLYDQMWNRPPPKRDRREQVIAEAARYLAESAGWPPPMALDDGRIDDPAYRPRAALRRAVGPAAATEPSPARPG